MKINSHNIEKCLPILCWENSCLVSKTADITVPFEITLPEVYSLGCDDFENLHQVWVRALRSLPDYCIVHKQDWFINSEVVSEQVSSSFLSGASAKHFKSRKCLNHRSFLYITLSSKNNMSTSSYYSILCRSRIVPIEMENLNHINDFFDAVKQFCTILKECGVSTRRLEESEMIGDKSLSGIIEQYLSLDFSEKCVLADLYTQEKDWMVGDKYVSCFSISDLDSLPSEVSTHNKHAKFSTDNTYFPVGYTHSIGIDLPFSHIYNQYFFLDNNKETLSAIEQRGKEQQSLSRISRENAINKSFNDSYLNEAVINSRRSVRCAANVLLWDENYLELLKKNAQIGACLTNMDCTANKTELIVPQIFWGGIPGASSQYPSEMTFLTFLEQASCFLNHESTIKTSNSGFGIMLCDRKFGVPLRIDISDEPRSKSWIDNRNKFILGPSGSGKSFFTNHMVRQYYEQGTHVVIVDVGDSYLGLCNLIHEESHGNDGIYYTYTAENPISFNPFYVKDGIYTVEKKEQLAALIFCLWKNESELITKAEETHVSIAINEYLDKIKSTGEFPDFNGFYNYLKGHFKSELSSNGVQRDNFDVDNLLQVLRPYSDGGMYDYLLNAKTNLDLLDKRFIVFEIDNIKDHKTLFPVVTLILMDTFISKMRHKSLASERKMILIEEAWKAISKNGTAEFIKYLYKTVRKHFGEAVVVTQEVEDIIGNEIVKNAIISNADCKILLDQRKYANRFDKIKQILALSDKETAIALSVNRDIKIDGRAPYKEVFISLNGNHTAVYSVEVSKEEYLTYTTEKKEKAHLLHLERETGSFRQAIINYINEEKSFIV